MDRARTATREDFLRLEALVTASVLPQSVSPAHTGTPLRWGGRTVHAIPIDTRRFVRAMARYICFN